jgi:hypothetical protein
MKPTLVPIFAARAARRRLTTDGDEDGDEPAEARKYGRGRADATM